MNRVLINSLATALVSALVVACSGEAKSSFVVEGKVAGGEGQMLYLEEVGTENVLSLDSVSLSGDGAFRFSKEGKAYPMFYRLRLGQASIPFVADSLTHIVVATDARNFFAGYTLSEADSHNHQIRDVALLRYQTDRHIDSIVRAYQRAELSQERAVEVADSLIESFKRQVCTHYIYVAPKSPAAYFALFQQKGGGGSYFSVEDDGDERAYAAVATAYDTYYADAPYTPFLKALALEAVAKGRERRAKQKQLASLNGQELKAVDFFEIKGQDSRGQEQSLTAMAERGAVLLSFTSYRAEWSPSLVGSLREISQKRPDLQIYELSEDEDSYLWRNATRNLPWVSILDHGGKYARLYNVQSLPSFYLIEGGKLSRLNHPNEVLR